MKITKKMLVLLTALIVVLCAAVGGTVAYLVTSTGPVTNTFTPSKVTTEIDEKFNEKVKNEVKIKNKGDVDAYIRAAVVITWQDANGVVLGQKPVAGTDYLITWTLNDWTALNSDGYYYYTNPVSANGGTTGVLFTECKPVKPAPVDGYTLHVEIISEAIQAEPTSVVTGAWGVSVDGNGNIQ